MKRNAIVLGFASIVCINVHADSATVNGVNWSYSIVNDSAIIGDSGTHNAAVNSYSTRGFVSVPERFGGKQLTRIGEYAFAYCDGITGIEIPDGVCEIGSRAFWDCFGLEEVRVPATLRYSGDQAFKYCDALNKVCISSLESWCRIDFDSTTSNPFWYAGTLFLNDVMLAEVDIPQGISEIKPYAFTTKANCSIGRVVIPSSVGYIGKSAFSGCGGITNIVFMGNAPSFLSDTAFSGVNESCVIYVAPVSRGWGVDIPGELNGIRIEYWPDSFKHVFDPVIEIGNVAYLDVASEISVSCVTEGATILYTIDGSNPLDGGLTYKGAFAVYKSCVVRAIAIKNGWENSAEVTTTFTRSESLSEAANLYGYTMETDEVVPWVVDGEVSRDGVSSVRSGAIGNNGTTWLQTSIKKAGTVSFWWKAACEGADEEEGEDGYYDYGAFLVDDVIVARIAGHDGEWHYVSHEIMSGGKHTLRWEYRKDGSTTYAPDCVWVDQVQWIPADGSGYTLTTPEPVPYAWLDAYRLGVGTDYETAGNAASGKMQGGRVLQVWQDYVAGTDPTNLASRFTAKIEMVDGAPVVKWEPDLNTNGVIRAYKVYGKETLEGGGEWQYPTNSLHRFFKVTVEMP